MLVNAATNPGAAMWQGIMLGVVALYALYLFSGNPLKKRAGVASLIVLGIGVMLALVILRTLGP